MVVLVSILWVSCVCSISSENFLFFRTLLISSPFPLSFSNSPPLSLSPSPLPLPSCFPSLIGCSDEDEPCERAQQPCYPACLCASLRPRLSWGGVRWRDYGSGTYCPPGCRPVAAHGLMPLLRSDHVRVTLFFSLFVAYARFFPLSYLSLLHNCLFTLSTHAHTHIHTHTLSHTHIHTHTLSLTPSFSL